LKEFEAWKNGGAVVLHHPIHEMSHPGID